MVIRAQVSGILTVVLEKRKRDGEGGREGKKEGRSLELIFL